MSTVYSFSTARHWDSLPTKSFSFDLLVEGNASTWHTHEKKIILTKDENVLSK